MYLLFPVQRIFPANELGTMETSLETTFVLTLSIRELKKNIYLSTLLTTIIAHTYKPYFYNTLSLHTDAIQ
jgi:hypothetical protein